MKYAFLVALHEYVENAKTKGFWIGMFMLPTLIFISVKGTVYLETKGTPQRHYVVVDQSGQFAGIVNSALEKKHKDTYRLAALPADVNTNSNLTTLAQALKPYLRHDKQVQAGTNQVDLDAALLIPRNILDQVVRPGTNAAPVAPGKGMEYWSVNLADTGLRDAAEEAVNTESRRREYVAHGMDAEAVRRIEQTYAPVSSLNPKKEEGKEEVSTVDVIRQWAPSGFVYLLWLGVFVISQMLLNNVIEEKSNRIIEVLLSSVTPGELMMGKLAGIACLGLTMLGAWILALIAALAIGAGEATGMAGQLMETLKSTPLIPMFCVYFLLGYLMYASFFLTLGSVCNTIKEAQNYMGVVTLVMMVPMLTMTFIPRDPNGTIARVLSWIPIYTPFIMLNRINASPPLVDLIGTAVLLLCSTVLALWMAGKVFRIGILRTGQPPRIVELWRWVRG